MQDIFKQILKDNIQNIEGKIMLEKKRVLRNIELTFTDDKLHPECHCIYHDVILEDGIELTKKVYREVRLSNQVKQDLVKKEMYVHEDLIKI